MEEEGIVVLDSHVLFWLLSNPRRLSARARRTIGGGKRVVVPIIALFEIFYLLEKSRLERTFPDVLLFLKEHSYLIYPIDREVLKAFLTTPKLEMHDRIIVATTTLVGGILVTKDREVLRAYPKAYW